MRTSTYKKALTSCSPTPPSPRSKGSSNEDTILQVLLSRIQSAMFFSYDSFKMAILTNSGVFIHYESELIRRFLKGFKDTSRLVNYIDEMLQRSTTSRRWTQKSFRILFAYGEQHWLRFINRFMHYRVWRVAALLQSYIYCFFYETLVTIGVY